MRKKAFVYGKMPEKQDGNEILSVISQEDKASLL